MNKLCLYIYIYLFIKNRFLTLKPSDTHKTKTN